MKTRVVSALVAAALLVGIYFLANLQGLYIICAAATIKCIFEYDRLTLTKLKSPLHIRIAFIGLTTALYFVAVIWDQYALYLLAVSSVIFLAMTLVNMSPGSSSSEDPLRTVLQYQTSGLMGFVYCGLFPAFVLRTIYLDQGALKLFGLLAIVFAGDTCAYLTGRVAGRTKLLASVSPKKTVEGALGGLIGSALVGVVLGLKFYSAPVLMMVATAMVTGLFAQVGDLFESLLKRVAEVKDSGTIMPGHGGMLDRLDGVLFSAPVYYVLIKSLA